MTGERKYILKRLEEIKYEEKNFRGMKWDNFLSGTIHSHINDFDFSTCDDFTLVTLFERILKRYYRQC